MGASGWSYFVPYQEDVQAALHALHESVFAEGKYYLRHPFWLDTGDEKYLSWIYQVYTDEKERNRALNQQRAILEELRSLGNKPSTIEELMRWNGEDGTHSIIDISKLVTTPEESSAFNFAPLSEKQLIETLGTTKPSHKQIEENESELANLRQRYEGTYIVVYKDNQPDEIFFTGYSGD